MSTRHLAGNGLRSGAFRERITGVIGSGFQGAVYEEELAVLGSVTDKTSVLSSDRMERHVGPAWSPGHAPISSLVGLQQRVR
jgi:hypothetical protein